LDEEAISIMADQLWTGTTLVEKESRSIGDVPVGGIVAWAKTLSGVPNLAEGWVECDGAVLVDSQSSLNGQTIPDLNGDNRFLRGDAASGGTGGSETSSHRHKLPIGALGGNELEIEDSWDTDGTMTTESSTSFAGAGHSNVNRMITETVAPSNLPTYYGVVWIMRVR